MEITDGKYIRMQKNDPDEAKLLDYLKHTGNGEQAVSFDEVGDDAMIQLRDTNYTPNLDEVLFQKYQL